MENIIGCVGPMANTIEDLKLFCEVALACRPWEFERSLIPIPWRSVPQPEKMTIGVMWNDGVVTPHPPVQRALREAVRILKENGHRIVEWDPKYHADLVKWISRAYLLDGGREYKETIEEGNELPVPVIQWLLDSASPPCSVEETWKVKDRGIVYHLKLIEFTDQLRTRSSEDSLRHSVARIRYRCPSLSRKRVSCFRTRRKPLLGIHFGLQRSRLLCYCLSYRISTRYRSLGR